MNLLLLIGVCVLLLVVGTLLGRYYAPDRRPLERAAEEGRAYVRSLVELLEGDPDGAIAEIVAALKRNTKTVEAYFALGTLFRNRGEHERAVRVHQTLLVRRDVDKKTKLRVHHQLALDFKAAGFPRRAVKALELVVTQDKKNVDALKELAALYEETGEWERAAGAHRRLGKLTKQSTSALQAHLLTQLAEELVERDELAAARKQLKRAVSASPESVHTLHVLANYQQERGDLAAAAKVWEKCLRLAPNLAAFFVPRLEVVLFELGKLDRLDRLFEELLAASPGHLHLRLAHARFDARRNPERALSALQGILDDAPGLLPARREAARLVLARGDPAQIRQAFEELLALLQRADRGYRCAACGYTAEELFWRCPGCAAWGSVGVAWGRRTGETARSRHRRSA
jgi:lipopolysaccharide biosynthesis regulator YciM